MQNDPEAVAAAAVHDLVSARIRRIDAADLQNVLTPTTTIIIARPPPPLPPCPTCS